MAFIVNSTGRRLAMAFLLALAVAGAVIRVMADNPSTLRDIGSLLLVLWVPAVGQLIGWLRGKMPAPKPPPTGFPDGQPFTAQLKVELTPLPPPGLLQALDPATPLFTVLFGRQGFTARSANPVPQWLSATSPQTLELEFLTPELALQRLRPQTPFHVLVGPVGVAKGVVLEQLAGPGDQPATSR